MIKAADARKEWKSKTLEDAKQVNAFVEKGLREGWENAGKEPEDNGREELVPFLLKAIRKANQEGDLESLREKWPLAHSPLIPMLENNGQSVSAVTILNDGRVVARIGEYYEAGSVVEIDNLKVSEVEGMHLFGSCPNARYFAYTMEDGILFTEGWMGEEVAVCPYPKGTEGFPAQWESFHPEEPIMPSKIIPFPDGKRVLYLSTCGIFVISPTECIRLLPTQEWLNEEHDFEEEWEEDEEVIPPFELDILCDMMHGAISKDGKYIAVGDQGSEHMVFDENLQLIGEIKGHPEYAHYSIISSDNEMIAFNACHFYNGSTIGIPTKLLPGLGVDMNDELEEIPILEAESRVYAGVYRKDEFIIGNADGWLRAFGKDGELHWQHFIGSTICDIALSEDESTLVCTSSAGYLCILKLDNGHSEPYEIGNGGHTETRRWLFWKDEKKPLAW